jgi:hypothetical protein
VTEKMMTYALGRGVEYEDMPMLRSIVRDSAPGKYRFTSIVMGIVKSAPFQSSMKTVETSAKPATTATPVARALAPAASALMPAKAVKR